VDKKLLARLTTLIKCLFGDRIRSCHLYKNLHSGSFSILLKPCEIILFCFVISNLTRFYANFAYSKHSILIGRRLPLQNKLKLNVVMHHWLRKYFRCKNYITSEWMRKKNNIVRLFWTRKKNDDCFKNMFFFSWWKKNRKEKLPLNFNSPSGLATRCSCFGWLFLRSKNNLMLYILLNLFFFPSKQRWNPFKVQGQNHT